MAIRIFAVAIAVTFLLSASASGANPQASLDPVEISIAWDLEQGETPPDGTTVDEADGERFLRVTFRLPADCSKLDQSVERFGYGQTGAQLRQLLWAQGFCDRTEFLARGEKTATHDFVSNLDFTRLPLELIPYSIRCSGVSSREWHQFCDRLADRDDSVCMNERSLPPLTYVPFFFSWVDEADEFKLDCRHYSVDEHSCRLTNSTFLGNITVSERKVICIHDPDGEGIRLWDVRFRDMNRDGLMDAVLSVGQAFHGSAPGGTDRFVLTKRGKDAPLEPLRERRRHHEATR